jgi:hypothetical protein
MAAPEGNEFWRLAEDPGRPKAYDPPRLLNISYDYFKWATENPWMKNEAVKGGDNAGMIIKVPTSRPFTIHGLCVFAGISVQTFDNYSKNKEFLEVTTRIREIIYNQKFEGAAVGAYNANIIARDLGLADKKEVNKVIKKLDFKDAL